MPSRKTALLWLIDKEWRDLLASRSWWVLLAATGPLVGMSFISAMHTYAEVSGLNGTSAGVGEAMSPLIGVWSPTFSACELVAVFLLPFVAIRQVSADRQNGNLKLELQQGMSSFTRMAVKAAVLSAGWLIAMLAPAIAILLWKSYGGTIYAPELLTLTLGHLLNAGLTVALAASAASVAEHPSTAAILTLGVTVGTWIVNFFGAIQGGIWERAASYTPAAIVAEFQHGLLRVDAVLVAVILSIAGLAFASIWLRPGVPVRRRASESIALLTIAIVAISASLFIRTNWDLSESRANSFSESEERALKQIREPIRIEAHLAPEDPRRLDLEQHAFSKLRRTIPNIKIEYISKSSIGLFEQNTAGYGEIWYFLGGRKEMSRGTSAESVLETIFSLAQVTPAAEDESDVFRGHPLAVDPRGAGIIFYFAWPILTLCAAFVARRML